jgi:hypothetical protein
MPAGHAGRPRAMTLPGFVIAGSHALWSEIGSMKSVREIPTEDTAVMASMETSGNEMLASIKRS